MHCIVANSRHERLSYPLARHNPFTTTHLACENYALHSPFLITFLKGRAVGDLGGLTPPKTGKNCLVVLKKFRVGLRPPGKARGVLPRADVEGAPRMARQSGIFAPLFRTLSESALPQGVRAKDSGTMQSFVPPGRKRAFVPRGTVDAW